MIFSLERKAGYYYINNFFFFFFFLGACKRLRL